MLLSPASRRRPPPPPRDDHNPSSAPSSRIPSLSCSRSLPEAHLLHHHFILNRLHSDPFLFNLLLRSYAHFGSIHDALSLLSSPCCPRDVFSFNFIISAFSRSARLAHSSRLFRQMILEGVLPDKVTYAAIFSTFQSSSFEEATFLHACILKDLDLPIATALIHMYGKCGCPRMAWLVFQNMHAKDVVAWNCIISVYAHQQREHDVLAFYLEMQCEEVAPDKVTFINLLTVCTSSSDLIAGQEIHSHIVNRGLETDVVVANATVNMYAKCGSLEAAKAVFYRLTNRNLITWNTMLGGFAQKPGGTELMDFLHDMEKDGFHLNKVTFLSIIHACPLPYLLAAFETIMEADVTVWNAVISACIKHGDNDKACQLFQEMQLQGFLPSEITLLTVVSAYSSKEKLVEGKCRHVQIVGHQQEFDVCFTIALIGMYHKCGRSDDAEMLFQRSSERNLVSFTSIISASVQRGKHSEAMELFGHIHREGLIPDGFTYSIALDACASLFALYKGKCIHVHVRSGDFHIDVALGTALVNMYSECGSFNVAKDIFHMLDSYSNVSFNAMISACTHHGHGNNAIRYFEEMQKRNIVPDNVTFLNVLSACSHAGLIEQGMFVFSLMSNEYMNIPTVAHYDCLVDLLGRAGQLHEAEDLIVKIHRDPSALSVRTLLSAYSLRIYTECSEYVSIHFDQMQNFQNIHLVSIHT